MGDSVMNSSSMKMESNLSYGVNDNPKLVTKIL